MTSTQDEFLEYNQNKSTTTTKIKYFSTKPNLAYWFHDSP